MYATSTRPLDIKLGSTIHIMYESYYCTWYENMKVLLFAFLLEVLEPPTGHVMNNQSTRYLDLVRNRSQEVPVPATSINF